MGLAYASLFAALKATNNDVMFPFQDIGKNSFNGNWGALENVTQTQAP
jgi:hypothetical protein